MSPNYRPAGTQIEDVAPDEWGDALTDLPSDKEPLKKKERVRR